MDRVDRVDQLDRADRSGQKFVIGASKVTIRDALQFLSHCPAVPGQIGTRAGDPAGIEKVFKECQEPDRDTTLGNTSVVNNLTYVVLLVNGILCANNLPANSRNQRNRLKLQLTSKLL
jgi:hypothetical protein